MTGFYVCVGVENHHEKYRYLLTLCHIVAESTICLMNYDRQQTISLILSLAQSILMEYQSNACFVSPGTAGNQLGYYRTYEPPYAPPLAPNGRPLRNLRNRTQAPRMRNRRLTANGEETSFGNPTITIESNMPISVL